MATNKDSSVIPKTEDKQPEAIKEVKTSTKAVVTQNESVYTLEEFAKGARQIFGMKVNPECVTAAFHLSGKDTATISEAKEIVAAFLQKEVK